MCGLQEDDIRKHLCYIDYVLCFSISKKISTKTALNTKKSIFFFVKLLTGNSHLRRGFLWRKIILRNFLRQKSITESYAGIISLYASRLLNLRLLRKILFRKSRFSKLDSKILPDLVNVCVTQIVWENEPVIFNESSNDTDRKWWNVRAQWNRLTQIMIPNREIWWIEDEKSINIFS